MLLHGGEIRDKIREATPVYFSPELTAAFLAVSEAEAFWLQLEPRGIQASLQDMLTRGHPHEASLGEVRQLAEIFARIVDAKSPFTAAHSLGVARLAKHFAQAMGLGDVICEKLEIAGLLHDLGKLRIPDEVLDKPGKLDARERQIINTHSFETYQILSRIQGFEEIARWASYHHARHYRIQQNDVGQALAGPLQGRFPFRGHQHGVARLIQGVVEQGKVFRHIVHDQNNVARGGGGGGQDASFLGAEAAGAGAAWGPSSSRSRRASMSTP